MSSGARNCPIQPVFAYSEASTMPATAVGSAKGRSTSASTIFLPKKSYRTSTQATMKPKNAFTSAASNDAPNVRRYDASATGMVMVCQNSGHVSELVFQKTADKGIRTMSPR